MERLKQTYSPCDECNYSYSKQNQESNVCKICEYKEYRNAEEQGLLLRLPCKIGSTLYDIIDFVEGNNFPEIYVIDASKIEVSKDKKGILYTIDCTDFRENDFGTTVFSSMKEAEQALAKMKEGVMNEFLQ